jgi:mono/diheme cytochrome c family protein
MVPAILGCDDLLIGEDHSKNTVEVLEHPTLCDVSEQVFEPTCVACHGPGQSPPDLSLQGARSSIVNVESSAYPGSLFVVPGDPGASFLQAKMSGDLERIDGRGAAMPLGGSSEKDAQGLVWNWIEDGAPTDCEAPPAGDAGPPPAPDDGGTGANLSCQIQSFFDADCVSCHSQSGGSQPFLDAANAEAALLLAPSPGFPDAILVVPHFPEASLLFRKSTGTQRPDEGGVMPVGSGPVSDTNATLLRTWIEDGAPFDCPLPDGGN